MKKLILLSTLLSAAALADPVVVALPNPAIGNPASVTGWGFTIANDTAKYLVVSGITPGSGTIFAVGSFAEFLATNFVVVNPGTTVGQAFDNLLQIGFGRFTISNSAAVGLYTGTFGVTYDLYVNDPNGPLFSPDVADEFGLGAPNVNVSLQVNASTSPVPEPSTYQLLGVTTLGLLWLARKRNANA